MIQGISSVFRDHSSIEHYRYVLNDFDDMQWTVYLKNYVLARIGLLTEKHAHIKWGRKQPSHLTYMTLSNSNFTTTFALRKWLIENQRCQWSSYHYKNGHYRKAIWVGKITIDFYVKQQRITTQSSESVSWKGLSCIHAGECACILDTSLWIYLHSAWNDNAGRRHL